MVALADEIDALAGSGSFAGVVSVSRGDNVEFERAYRLADRAHRIECAVDTIFATASATKSFTAATAWRSVLPGPSTCGADRAADEPRPAVILSCPDTGIEIARIRPEG